MKVIPKNLPAFVLLSLAALVGACTNPVNDGTPAEPISLYEKIAGNWVIDTKEGGGVAQIDETAKRSGIKPNEISLTDQFDFVTFSLTLNLDGEGNPAGYTASGNTPALFPASGYWDLSTPFLLADSSSPILYLYSDASRTTLTSFLKLLAIPGSEPKMELALTRSTAGIPYVTYHYKLSRAKTN